VRKSLFNLLILAVLPIGQAQELPSKPSAANYYVFYLHGRIIEDGDQRPVHATLGLYDYPGVVRALGARGAVVISEPRPKDADVAEYATKVRGQIASLVKAGVPQSHISVVGFSKGGAIAITVSSTSGEQFPQVRYVFLAACTDWVSEQPNLSLSGHALAISEATDEATQGCSGLAKHSRSLQRRSEIAINTGAGHGAFYLPREVWVKPTLQWIHGS
jgi:hypothetical protein